MKKVITNNLLKVCGMTAALGLLSACTTGSGTMTDKELSSLVPDKPGTAPNYYCTWFMQNYKTFQGELKKIDPLLGGQGNWLARKAINEKNMIGDNKDGWIYKFHPRARQDLIFIMDHGWQEGGFFTSKLNSEKFPSYKQYDYPVRLKKLNETVKDAGWRALGLWTRGTPSKKEMYKMVDWSKQADILYWKIDMGDTKDYLATQASDELYPELTVEHVWGRKPLNGKVGNFGGPSAIANGLHNMLEKTEVFRNYDVACPLSAPTSLQRAVDSLQQGMKYPQNRAFINVEDEVTMAAALGCTMGVMRHPEAGKRMLNGKDIDIFLNGNRQFKKRMDEVARALLWQRIAHPMNSGEFPVFTSDEILKDYWKFQKGDTFWAVTIGKNIMQSAPAVVARNMELPTVVGDEVPYVMAATYPNGAVSVGTLGRTSVDKGYYHPLADVTIKAGSGKERIGIFGKYKSLTIEFDRDLEGARIAAQDLLETSAKDITNRVKIEGNMLILDGALIEEIGTAAQTEGDISDAGMVLKVL